MQIYYDKDCDLSIIQSKKVSVIGYGSQGHAQACNLKDSGVDVTVGLRTGSSSVAKAEAHSLKVLPVAEAVAQADLVMILTPVQVGNRTKHQARCYARVLTWLLNSLQPGGSTGRSGRDYDRTEGARSYGT